jgi:hypothetical protein
MKRYYAKFAEVDEGRDHNESSVHYEDDVYAFFINCYHLKDWIKNDPAVTAKVPSIGIDIEAFIGNAPDGNEYLQLCGDICNSQKHFVCNKSNRSRENPKLGSSFTLIRVGKSSSIKISWSIHCGTRGSIDAFVLATECVKAWDSFLSGKGLK